MSSVTDTQTSMTAADWFYDQLHYIPKEDKDVLWCAKVLLYDTYHQRPFLDPQEAAKIRAKMNGHIDVQYYKNIIDPLKGTAEYFHADWKACPLDQHLDEILETTVKQLPFSLGVKAVDEYSINNREQNNRKILNRGLMRTIINSFLVQMNFPLLKASDDPFAFIQQLQQSQQQQAGGPAPVAPKGKGIPQKKFMPADLQQTLLSQIDSQEQLGIYNQYVHKEGVEIACELGIDYYVNVKNKWSFNYASDILSDIKAFNRCCFRMFTSKTTGTPEIQHFRPEDIRVSPFQKRDLSDIRHWGFEMDISYADFTKMFGADLDNADLVRIFQQNHKYNGGPVWDPTRMTEMNKALIRVGYHEFQTQDFEVYADYTMNGNDRFKKVNSDFVPGMMKNKRGNMVKEPRVENSTRVEEHRNMWYKCYYIPYFFSSEYGTFNIVEQSKFIFDFAPLQDQQRYGDDLQFARSSLLGFYSNRRSWFEIKESFMERITHLWLLFQNDLANVQPHGLNWAYEAIVIMSRMSDEKADASPKDAIAEWLGKLRQTGSTVTKQLRDSNNNIIPGAKAFELIETGHLKSAVEKLEAIGDLYQLMLKALGQNDISEGDAPKPRTNLGSIQLALGASGKSMYYVEEAYSGVLADLGNKLIIYFKDIVDNGTSKRLQEFKDIVGQANYTALMEIKNIPLANLGIYVEPVMTKEQKDLITQVAQSMASAGTLDIPTALFLAFVDNLREAYAILSFKKIQMDKQLAQQAQQQQQWKIQLGQQQLQIELAKIKANTEGKKEVEEVLGKIQESLVELEMNLKGHWAIMAKEQIKNNRIEQDVTKSQIDKMNDTPAMPVTKDMPQVNVGA